MTDAPITPTRLARPVAVGQLELEGELGVPARPRALVLFAHGNGNGVALHSACHDDVAHALHARRLATLMVALLRRDERCDRYKAFDVELLRERLETVFDWIAADAALSGLPLGVFGSGLDAAAAVLATQDHQDRVFALVSRQGRTELVRHALSKLAVPTLLISDDGDDTATSLDQRALRYLPTGCRGAVVPPGPAATLPRYRGVAQLAEDWYVEHLPTRKAVARHAPPPLTPAKGVQP